MQGRVLDPLSRLAHDSSLAAIRVAHDLDAAWLLICRTAVKNDGEVVEQGHIDWPLTIRRTPHAAVDKFGRGSVSASDDEAAKERFQ